MGCVSTKEAPLDPNASPEEQAKAQRRRLSVAPQHVGDIDAKGPKDKAADKPEEKSASQNTPNADGLNDTEARARGKCRHSSLSKKGFVPYNKNKVNQDREVVKYGICNDPGMTLFAVMDGHGEFGHFVANFVKERLPEHIGRLPNVRADPPAAISKAVKALCDELAGTNINIAFSGTTAIFALKVDTTMYVANIGDSRCVLARKNGNMVEAVALSNDQKPENPDEKARILRAGGRVEPLPGPPGEDCGPPRVWLAEVDVPGLAMSRSIGDEVSQTVGVISEPEILRHDIDPNADLFAIWATDGVWEFISNQDAVDIVNKHRASLPQAAEQLVAAAHERWTREEEVVDDITCIILDFDPSLQ